MINLRICHVISRTSLNRLFSVELIFEKCRNTNIQNPKRNFISPQSSLRYFTYPVILTFPSFLSFWKLSWSPSRLLPLTQLVLFQQGSFRCGMVNSCMLLKKNMISKQAKTIQNNMQKNAEDILDKENVLWKSSTAKINSLKGLWKVGS